MAYELSPGKRLEICVSWSEEDGEYVAYLKNQPAIEYGHVSLKCAVEGLAWQLEHMKAEELDPFAVDITSGSTAGT